MNRSMQRDGGSSLQPGKREVNRRRFMATSAGGLVAGAVLLTPGILTDALGFALLIPVIRQVFKRTALAWIQRNVRVQQVHYRSGFGPQPDFTTSSAGDRIVDAKVIETRVVDPEDHSP